MTSTEEPGRSPRVVVVAGSGRSGTSTVAGALKMAGLRIPPPEVPGNRTNPRGFFEPRWAVDHQTRLLRRAGVALTDARPGAFDLTATVAEAPAVRRETAAWLREHLDGAPGVLVKDPRSSWFLPMWREAATQAGAQVAFLTMLRHPAEVVGSKDKYYKSVSAGETPRHAQTTRLASWLNVALFTEATTRDSTRCFVRYNDLLDDWRLVLGRVVSELDLSVDHLATGPAAEIDEFIDPGLHRVHTGWDDIDCPDEVRVMAQEVWDQLGVLVSSGGRDAAAEARLDEVREQYTSSYLDAEALAQSTAEASRRTGAREAKRRLREAQQAEVEQAGRAAAPSGQGPAGDRVPAWRRVARRLRGLRRR